jgi:rhomboid protease GluP
MTTPDPQPPQPADDPSATPPPVTFGHVLEATTPRAYVIWIIIIANVAIFLAMGFTGVGWFTPTIAGMEKWGADSWPLTTSGQWWRLFTSAFLHFGLLHLAFNMWALMQVGDLTERLFGNVVFALIYVFSAVLSGFASTWWDKNAVSAGASGAIFGVYGALLAYVVFQRRSFPPAAVKSLATSTLLFIGYNVFYGVATPGISNAAHLGGLVSGFFLGAIAARPLMPQARARQALPRLAALLLIGIGAIGVSFAAIPRYPDSPEAKFEALKSRLVANESEAIDAFRTLEQDRAASKLKPAEFADAVDRQVVARWGAMLADVSAYDPKHNKSLMAQQHNLQVYCQERRQGYALISEGRRTSNPIKVIRGESRIAEAVAHLIESQHPVTQPKNP